MKILHIIPSLHGGGAEKFCIDLCNELSKTDDVTICSLFDISEDMFMAKAILPNVHIVTLKKKLGLDIKIFFKIFWLLYHGNYDIVNTHLRALFYSVFGIVFTKNKFYHTVHSIANKETSKANRVVYKMLFRFFGVTPVGISKQVSDSIQSVYGQRFNLLIENGLNKPTATAKLDDVKLEFQSYKKMPESKIFLSIGRISSEKNHKMLVDTFNRLIAEGRDVVLVIIGDDYIHGKPLRTKLEREAKKGIYFLGMKENIADYLLCSDAFCLSSIYEGLPITLLEAMSLGIIPICTPVGGIVDVIDNYENGLLSNDISGDAFYEVISTYLAFDESMKSKLSLNSKQKYYEKYSIERTAKNYISEYMKALND